MIVSDSTILITLINIDEFELLESFVKSIIITKEVYEEVSQKIYAKNFIDAKIDKGYMRIENYSNRQLFYEINTILDKGESASITLAIEKSLPLIIDEKKGRRFAKAQGVEVVGLIGILRYLYLGKKLSKKQSLEIIKKLNNSNFRIDKKLMEMILG
jgi:predicted nucleic acid-binding protein